ncbi:hypothetical protein [Stenotrophomonas phage RAS14]
MAELSTLGNVIKVAYESQNNTNAFTDQEKAKLLNIATVASTGSFDDLTNVPEFVQLDESGTIPLRYLNVSGLTYKGAWDASTNTPTVIDGTGAVGDFYKVSVGGTQNFGNGSFTFVVGDLVMFAAGIWQRIGVHESVSAVNGKIGNVTLTAEDVGAKANSYTPSWTELSGKPNFASLYQEKMRGAIGPAIPAAMYRRGALQSTTSGAFTKVVWDTKVYDQFDIWDGVDGFVMPSWARYARVTGRVTFGNNATGIRSAGITLNNNPIPGCGFERTIALEGDTTGGVGLTRDLNTPIFPVTAGDVLRAEVWQNSGIALQLLAPNTTTRIDHGICIELFE